MNTVTENGCPAYAASGSALVDFFTQCRRDAPRATWIQSACHVWNQDPRLFLQVLCYTRDPRRGKGERAVSYQLLQELRARAPLTYEANMNLFYAELGCWKDIYRVATPEDCEPEVQMVAYQLLADLRRILEEGASVSLCAKWCPSEKSPYAWFSRRVAQVVFPRDPRAWARLRTEVLSPLRARARLVEHSMCARDWGGIDYARVPARATLLYRQAFLRHDPERYQAYLDSVRRGEGKIQSAGCLPHELVQQVWIDGAEDDTVEAQWRALLEPYRSKGTFSRTVAVVDVSGSMQGRPMQVAIALGLFVSQLCEGVFHRQVIPFSHRAQLVRLTGDTLAQDVQQLRGMTWSANTDFLAVFDLLLSTAVLYKVPPEQMVETVFVFTDMEFDATQTSGDSLETAYEAIERMYAATPYTCPRLIFWNLKEGTGTDAFPIRATTPRTALLSGFSPALLHAVLASPHHLTPEEMVRAAIAPYRERVQLPASSYLSFPWMVATA